MPNPPSFLAISDVHLGLNLYNIPELGADLARLFSEACKLAVSLHVDFLVIAGDLYESNKPTPDMIRFVRSQIEDARLGEVRVVGIAGDHDKPINTESWSRLSGVAPVDATAQFAGHDYSDNPEDISEYIKNSPHRNTTEWIFLHGQVPTLWPFCDGRKKIDLGAFPLFELYPNLRGVVLGDIHKPYEGKLVGPGGRSAYVGYCGSLGITASNDIGEKIGLLHFDGKVLKRVPFSLGRDFVKVDLTSSGVAGLDLNLQIEKYKKNRGRRPVFLVEYSASTKDRLNEIRPLYQLGFVRAFQQRKNVTPGNVQQAVSIRSDLNNQDRITSVLADLVPDDEVRNLIQSTLDTEDPKLVLDTFRRKYLDEKPASMV